jgi:molybdate transport system substrate-binding protein
MNRSAPYRQLMNRPVGLRFPASLCFTHLVRTAKAGGGRLRAAILALLGGAALAVAAACGGEGGGQAAEAEALLVLAAADLQAAMPELVAHYEATTGRRAEVILGSTGNLTSQIEQGAPGDVFLAANESFIDRLAGRDLILPESRRVYAIGPLVLVSAAGVPLPASVADLADAGYGTIAIANPEHAPYGMAAREAMQSAGVWDAVRPRLVMGENIAQALQFVRTGNADAGIVALGLVVQLPDMAHRLVDPGLHAPLRQTGAVLRGSARPADAAAFLDLVTGERGQAILQSHGFEPPDRR